MNLRELVDNAARWLSGEDDAEGMVVSCRARLARNLSASPFAPKATLDDQERVIERVLGAAQRSRQLGNAAFFKMNALQGNERRLLVERHLISPALADSKGQRGVLFSSDESLSVMINEEDHLRLQAVLPGLQAPAAGQQRRWPGCPRPSGSRGCAPWRRSSAPWPTPAPAAVPEFEMLYM